RDTVLARLSRESFLRLAERYPSTIVQLTRQLASWLVQTNERRALLPTPVATLALLPLDRSVPSSAFCRTLADALSQFGKTGVVSAETVDAALGNGVAQTSEQDPGNDTLARWLDAREASCRFLIYEADPEPSAWSHRCLRQADRVLHLARGD